MNTSPAIVSVQDSGEMTTYAVRSDAGTITARVYKSDNTVSLLTCHAESGERFESFMKVSQWTPVFEAFVRPLIEQMDTELQAAAEQQATTRVSGDGWDASSISD